MVLTQIDGDRIVARFQRVFEIELQFQCSALRNKGFADKPIAEMVQSVAAAV